MIHASALSFVRFAERQPDRVETTLRLLTTGVLIFFEILTAVLYLPAFRTPDHFILSVV